MITMTENTIAEAPVVEAPETDASEVEETTEVESDLFDLDALDENATDPISVFFNQTKPLYNKLAELSSVYKSLSNTDDAVAEFLKNNTDPKVKQLTDHRAELEAQLAKIQDALVALANQHVAETVGNGKTPDSIKKEYQDTNAALSDLVNPLRPMFVFMGIVSESKPEATADNKRPRSTFKSNGTPQGDDFIKLLNRPSLSAGTPAGTGEGKLIREWANATGWVDAEGNPLAKQGKLPESVKEAYRKANAS
jgi:hypothetical protein